MAIVRPITAKNQKKGKGLIPVTAEEEASAL
jgi:hypothetical protein